tara:strand:- start:18490 stop:18960 length:471 start_codon:yes stop_codon:yes gene_type:complete
MASVPNTTTFSLQDVVDAVGGSQSSLLDCVEDAVGSGYNPTYGSEGDLDMLSFRDYEEVAAEKAITISPFTYVDVSGLGADITFTVNTTSSWVVSLPSSDFLASETSSGTGSGSFTVNVAFNGTGEPRTGQVRVTTTGVGTNVYDTSYIEQDSGFE